RLDGERVDRLTERARRMDDRAIDAGGRHLRERIAGRVCRDLAMLGAHLAVLPEVDLGIDDQHRSPPDDYSTGIVGNIKARYRTRETRPALSPDCSLSSPPLFFQQRGQSSLTWAITRIVYDGRTNLVKREVRGGRR